MKVNVCAMLALVGIVLSQEVKRRVLYDDGILTETYIGTDADDDLLEEEVPSLEPRIFDFVFKKARKLGKALHLYKDDNQTLPLVSEEHYKKAIDLFKRKLKLIYPGTHWCGDGDNARSFDDLGFFKQTDRCCRGHDKCPSAIGAGKSEFGLNNTGIFTRSHCDCDKEFYDCLKNATDITSGKIGFTYFTLLGPQCFKEDYASMGCTAYNKGKCVQYHMAESGQKSYQWFDSPPF